MAHYRKIIVDGHEWEWCVGGRGVILRDGKHKHNVSLEDIHVSRRDMEKGNASITPGIIANYIKFKGKIVSPRCEDEITMPDKLRKFWIRECSLEMVDRMRASGVQAFVEKPDETYRKDPSVEFTEYSAYYVAVNALLVARDRIKNNAAELLLGGIEEALKELGVMSGNKISKP